MTEERLSLNGGFSRGAGGKVVGCSSNGVGCGGVDTEPSGWPVGTGLATSD